MAKWCVKDHVSKMVCDTVPCFHVTSTPFFMLAVPYQHASNPFLGADQGESNGGGARGLDRCGPCVAAICGICSRACVIRAAVIEGMSTCFRREMA